jgi:hypothetical protein
METIMRTLLATLALLLAIYPAAADDYGERLCTKFMAGAPCSCVGPLLEEEYDEEELEPLLLFMKSFMEGLKGDEAAAQKVIDQLAAKYGQAKIEGWMKRYSSLEGEMEKTCKWKW